MVEPSGAGTSGLLLLLLLLLAAAAVLDDGAEAAVPAPPSSPARSTAGSTPVGEALAVAQACTAKRALAKRR